MLPSHSNPLALELNRLENLLREKERELVLAYNEIKALKVTELLKDKAVVELSNELKKLDEKLGAAEKQLQDKNLEIKRLTNEKKEALAAQFAAEAALRRVHAGQKDEKTIPLEAIVAPLESEIKRYKNEVAMLQEDKKASERATKSKEAALIEAENILCGALERALIVEEVQNQNIELRRQIEICQEEKKFVEKTNRQRTVEVEKLTQTIRELEESILAGGAAANAVRDYQRQVSEMKEEKRILKRELARVGVSANRVASVAANEWKDDRDKVMPVKQWLEERRFFQAEIQRLRDKIAVAERTAKAESQLKEKLKMRLKALEEGLKNVSNLPATAAVDSEQVTIKRPNSHPRQTHASKVLQQPNSLSQGAERKRSTSQPRASVAAKVSNQPNSVSESVDSTRKSVNGYYLVRKNLWAQSRKFVDDTGKENKGRNINSSAHFGKNVPRPQQVKADAHTEIEPPSNGVSEEVINSRKLREEKGGLLSPKDGEIQVVQEKEDESVKTRSEAAATEKESPLSMMKENKRKSEVTNRAAKLDEAVQKYRT
ncbi:Microtubule-associated protein 70-4 [Ananas comosus]|uniref:Microtubule-associated protein 70-4 n=1 Tax=Ananas comosus TaxID=4615 RepID=A0A199V6Y5_ANACO|nr:Microtubule-associated protein 70-4 [Ananas comosus]